MATLLDRLGQTLQGDGGGKRPGCTPHSTGCRLRWPGPSGTTTTRHPPTPAVHDGTVYFGINDQAAGRHFTLYAMVL
ncbi:hypothetical protein [Streptomyces phytophilus]|uniref:hypothetical protein n=1 Tax=Streptomyces phytophilus TaxID=722715 RepID=UPI0035A8DCE0